MCRLLPFGFRTVYPRIVYYRHVVLGRDWLIRLNFSYQIRVRGPLFRETHRWRRHYHRRLEFGH
jgi:hypothetical protein